MIVLPISRSTILPRRQEYLDGLGLATSVLFATDGVIFDVEEENFTKGIPPSPQVVHFPGTGRIILSLPGETKLISNVACNHLTLF